MLAAVLHVLVIHSIGAVVYDVRKKRRCKEKDDMYVANIWITILQYKMMDYRAVNEGSGSGWPPYGQR